ncbi:Pheromone receptor transcription factor domain protein [Saccharomyces cerevisiae]|nr:Pheromone receptor transcription factor domain protein [Saccharomyces cerevisiae]
MSQQQMSQHPRPQQGIPHPQQSQPQQQQQQQQQQQPLTGIHQPHQQAFANAASPYLNAEQNAAYQQYFQEPQQGQY